MSNKKIINILIPLDVILDTVIATIARIDNTVALDLLKTNYHKRKCDFFPNIDKKEFDRLYAARDLETLSKSQLTNVFYVIKDILIAIIQKSIKTPFVEDSLITINTYPYNLDPTQARLFADAVFYRIGKLCPVVTESISDENLTPQFIKGRFDILFMYKYDHWLEMHTKDFEKIQIPEVELYVPAISFTHNLTDELLKDLLRENKTHPIDQLRFALAPFINLQPLDASVFSVYHPEEIRNTIESQTT